LLIGQFLLVGFIVVVQALLQGEALVLLFALKGGSGLG